MLTIGTLALAVLPPAGAGESAAASQRHQDWATLIHEPGNLYSVTPTFFRSALLRKDDVKRLQALGIKTVVSLRAFHNDEKVLKGSGIKPVSVPINTWDISDRKIIEALRAIRTAEQHGPVLLHCQHGADRTGLVTAMYRILYQQRSKEDALREMKEGGYGYHAVWKNIESYLLKVDVEAVRAGVEKESP
ncbi:protein tyrosine phosphatase [Massilia sp. Root418]|uniref:dual specificity protein phosphatase family protein n=1 Tax=Massilia sp. Root418 TaxID=1736532 RepID=UPI0006FB4087|nr:dual specificity protein phosphatase family protein [Massilia sp. Root418]KQX01292.1 protein tyrosine phosphatase [Massilia sp. Root418]